ncbi:MAG: LacI family DNA-binding transcriptional regulator [Lachnospiraceae bacterium]|nr:LacI family DNA-binding transcriptional regulator [Lachnospiraceae bacterium]
MVKPVKMADIAEKLNVSTVTVSKALTGQKGVSDEMRMRIKELAREMGYKYTGQMRDKQEEKSYNIGIVISNRYLDNSDSFYWKMYQEVASLAMAQGVFTLLELLNEEDELEGNIPKLIEEDKVDGVIVIGKPGHDYVKVLEKNVKIPMVFLDFYDTELKTDSVISNSYIGAYMLTDYLIRAGHKRIAYVGTLMVTDSVTDRYMGYAKALMERGLPLEQDLLIKDRDLESGLRDTEQPITLPDEMPSAFVCNCDFIASLVIKQIRQRGLRVPEDVSVVGFDNYLYPGLCDIGITTYEVDIREMARQSLSILTKIIKGETHGTGLNIVEGRLIEKDSVAIIS